MPRAARLALLTVPAVVLLGLASGWLSNSGYGNGWFAALRKPAFMPPAWVFPVAWTLLYAMQGVAIALVLATPGTRRRRGAIALFAVQLALNLLWSPLFFGLHEARAALALILVLVAAATLAALACAASSRAAGLLMLPYLGWLLFAAALNAAIVQLN